MSAKPASQSHAAAEPPPAPAGTPSAHPAVVVRRLRPTDSITDLTDLLHRAYAKQTAMGLHALASHQSPEVTRSRVSKGECFVAIAAGPGPDGARERIVGTIMFQEPSWGKGPRWFQRPDVCNFSQFAVEPSMQGSGIGLLLLEAVERRAAELGFRELALSTAEPDSALVRFYRNRGFRDVEHYDWGVTNYTSLIMSKALPHGASASPDAAR
ncbi:MAG: GNAT family N-acetyltransferase [Phycisphaeraceae bacterium]|nr:GNAT family N-acetyltransferase [Phycisphaeraceae bacterium]